MVKQSVISRSMGARAVTAALGLLLLGACQAPPPASIHASLDAEPAFAERRPSDIAVLPIEDGTGGAVAPLGDFMRQELMRQLVGRHYAPLTAIKVDVAVRAAAAPAGESMMTPAALSRVAGRAEEDATLAVRVDRWDEGALMTRHTVQFQFQVAMVAKDGTPLWSGTLGGEIKAGGAGPSPVGRDAAARSCATLAIGELMARMPMHEVR